MSLTLRLATSDDASAIAGVFSPSLRLLTFLPELHSVDEDLLFIGNVILKECEVTVAEDESHIVSFLARDGEEVRLLHTHPDFTGKGAGSLLVGSLQKHNPLLRLWCFQQNTGARRFYERHGFHAERFTNGEDNEEKMPDLLYYWRRQ